MAMLKNENETPVTTPGSRTERLVASENSSYLMNPPLKELDMDYPTLDVNENTSDQAAFDSAIDSALDDVTSEDAAPTTSDGSSDKRITIDVTGDQKVDEEKIAQVVKRFNGENPDLFKTAGKLTRVGRDDDSNPVIVGHRLETFTSWLSENVVWTKTVRGNTYRCGPSDVAVKSLMASVDRLADVPVLQRVASVPFFTPRGDVVNENGYSRRARTWYEAAEGLKVPEVPDDPSDDQVSAAVSLIVDDLFVDFPFDSEASRANAVALLIEPFVRLMINGPTPLHLIGAPTPGTGKSLLAEICISTACAPGSFPSAFPLSNNEEEVRKSLLARLMTGQPFIYFDNIKHRVNSGALEMALTARSMGDRKLGVTGVGETVINQTWVMTQNNATFSRDLVRRASSIRLDLSCSEESNDVVANPETRTGFKHTDVKEWARDNQGDLIAAVMTLVNAWLASGRPRWSGKPMGSFEEWSNTLGGILENAGITGFQENRGSIQSDDPVDGDVAFLQFWWERRGDQGIKPGDVWKLACEFQVACEGMPAPFDTTGTASKAGYWLKKVNGRLFVDEDDDAGFRVIDGGYRAWRLTRREG